MMMASEATNRSYLKRYAWISIAAAVFTIILKGSAYLLTGSVGLLSDAMESFVNLVGALMALAMLTIAARPADEEHEFGHSKAEYFSSGLEGALILFAAVGIAFVAIERIIKPRELEQIGLGLIISVIASIVNLGASVILMRASQKYESITLEANARHLLTDVWTSAGVILGVGAVAITKLLILDPIIAIVVAINIIWTGIKIITKSAHGLMDKVLPLEDINSLQKIFEPYINEGIHFHALRTRQAGARRFVSFHVVVPGNWSVQRGHQLLERIEEEIRNTLKNVNVLTHLESLDDPTSWDDVELDRKNK